MNTENFSDVSSETISISKIVRNLQQQCDSASGGWETLSIREMEKDIRLEAIQKWIELTFSDGLIFLKKAETIAKLKGHSYIETADINHAFIIHKNGLDESLPDPRSSSDLIPIEITNQVKGIRHIQ